MTTTPLLAPPRRADLPFDLRQHGHRVAVRHDRGVLTYDELASRIDAVAQQLGAQRRLVLLPARNDLASLVGYLAALAAGCPVLLTSADAPYDELVATYDPDVVLHARAEQVRVESRHDVSAHELHPDLALLLSTSGSTGSPKLVRLSYDNLVANAGSIAEYLGIRPSDCAATTLPLHYCYGLSVVHSHLLAGAALLLTDLSVVDECFWTRFRAAGATTFAAVPYTFDLLDRAGFAERDLPTLRYVTQAGGRLAPDRVQHYTRLGRRRGWDLVVMYGQTEATARMAYLPAGLAESHPQAIGRAVPGGSFRLRPVEGCDDPDAGELVYSGPNVMLGYAHTPADLALGRTVHELATGDLARRAGDPSAGLYEVLGRIDRHAKVFGLRIDLDRVQRVLADGGIASAVAAGTDRLVVAVDTSVHDGHRGHAAVRKARRLAAEACGVPAGAVVAVAVPELPRTANGKPDHRAVAELAMAPASVPERAAPDASTAGLVALYREVLDRRDATADDTFASLGGDSLSYVEMSVRLAERLGSLPAGWHVTPVRELCPATRRRRGKAVDTSVLLRAVSIVLVVGTHANLFFVQGGAHLLLAVAGYNFARFPLEAPDRRTRLRNTLGSLGRLALPASLWIAVAGAVTGMYGPANVLLLNWLAGPATWTVRWQFWFVETVVWTTAGTVLLLAVPWLDRAERRRPFGFALATLAATLGYRYATAGVEGQHFQWYSPATVLWLFALGWAVARAGRWHQRLLVAAVAAVAVTGFFGEPARETLVVAGVLLLVVAPQLRLPALVVRGAAAVASVSLYVYVTHWQVYPHLEDRWPLAAVLASFVVGAAYWWLCSRIAPAAFRALRGGGKGGAACRNRTDNVLMTTWGVDASDPSIGSGGAACRNRTDDLLITSETLYRLS